MGNYTKQELEEAKAALNMHNKIINKVNDLAIFPKRGRPVPDKKMATSGFRMLGIKPYIAFYRITNNDVFIYRILHGAMNYPLLYEKMPIDFKREQKDLYQPKTAPEKLKI
jgi:plasmid stabilization system protein ParE